MQSDRVEPAVIVFDLGGVLIDWNPRHLYRKLFDDEPAMERFLAQVCTPAWNVKQDAGRSFAEGIEELAARYPDQRGLIEAYYERWSEMLAGPIDGAVAIMDELRGAGHEVHALSNWSGETWPIARERYPFLDAFDTILISAEVGVIKPDPRIFLVLLERIGHAPEDCLFVDDALVNVAASETLGFDAIHFTGVPQLRTALCERGLLADS